MKRNSSFNNSNCTMDSDIPIDLSIPLPVLIRRMLDNAFGKSKSTIEVTEDQCTFENKNCKKDSSLISRQDKSSHDETNDCSSLHESVSDCIKRKNNKLITIEEENTNSLHYSNNIDLTGIYLNRLPKSNDNSVYQIDHSDSLPLRNDTETFASQIDTDISSNNSSCCTDFTNFYESSISQQNNDDNNESAITVNTTHSFNGTDVSSNDENTADFLNILKKGNSPETRQVSCKSLSSLEKDRKESSIDASLLDADFSSKSARKFISRLILKKHGSKASLNTSNKLLKTPRYNVSLLKTQYRTSFYMKVGNTSKTSETTKISNIHSNPAKPFKSFKTHEQKQMAKPQIIFTPATPGEHLK